MHVELLLHEFNYLTSSLRDAQGGKKEEKKVN
jgi:hypothetical protein